MNTIQSQRLEASDPKVDALIAILVLPPLGVCPEDEAREILKAARDLDGRMPVLTTFMAFHGVPEILSDGHVSIPSYPFPETAARTLARAAEYGEWLTTPEGQVTSFPEVRREGDGDRGSSAE